MSDLYNLLANRLTYKFSQSQPTARVLSLAVLAEQNVLLHGPGGYAKTEMILEFLRCFDKSVSTGMLECSPETTVSDLLGGAIAETRGTTDKEGNTLEITRESVDYGRGPLESNFFFLEEALDSSFRVISALKALITNKSWNGRASQNLSFLAATNIDPYKFLQNLSDVDRNSYDAFLQRFLVVEHGWKSHDVKDYVSMVEAGYGLSPEIRTMSMEELNIEKGLVRSVKFDPDFTDSLAYLASESSNAGRPISPRTFMYLRRMVRASAYLDGRDNLTDDDLQIIEYFGSFSPEVVNNVRSSISDRRNNSKQSAVISSLKADFQKILKIEGLEKNKFVKYQSLIHHLGNLKQEIRDTKFSDSFFSERDDLLSTIYQKIGHFEAAARDSVVPLEIPQGE